jgi:serine/threonine protein phosphatase 1
MATIAIGDVHGHRDALDDVLATIRDEIDERDRVVFLGDYIDRGHDSKGCIDSILRFRHEVSAEVVCLLGNHEDWFLQTRRDHRRHSWLLGMEAFDTIRSYSGEAARLLRDAVSLAGPELLLGGGTLPYHVFFDGLPAAHVRFFDTLRPFFEGPDCVCTHGGLDPRVAGVQAQTLGALLWGAEGFPHRYDGPATVVYGHWNNAVLNHEGWPSPAIHGRTIGIDTIAHGVLTAIRLPDRRVFQSARYAVRGADG